MIDKGFPRQIKQEEYIVFKSYSEIEKTWTEQVRFPVGADNKVVDAFQKCLIKKEIKFKKVLQQVVTYEQTIEEKQ